jgi:hypothetical protein
MIQRLRAGSQVSRYTDNSVIRVVQDDDEDGQDDYDASYLKRLEQPSNSDFLKGGKLNRPYSTT